MRLLDEQEDTIFRRYLLAELSPEQESEIEEQLFLDKEFFRQLQMAEEELIDDYVYNELTANERTRFENSFLSLPERRESLRIALALSKYHPADSAPLAAEPTGETHSKSLLKLAFLPFLHFRNPVLKFSVLAAQLLIVLGGLWLLIRAIQQRSSPEPIQVQSPQQPEKKQTVPPDSNPEQRRTNIQEDKEFKPDQQTAPPNQNQPLLAAEEKSPQSQGPKEQPRQPKARGNQSSVRIYSSVILPFGPVRSEGDVNKLELPADADVAELRLPLVKDMRYSSYQATLGVPGGKTLRTWKGLKPKASKIGPIVVVRVPAKLLSSPNYQIEVSGLAADGNISVIKTYTFTVSTK